MTVESTPIRLVLDTSAILAFTRGSIHVGEPLSEVADEGGVAGLPAECLAEARWMVDDVDRLNLLLDHHATVVVPGSDDWQALAAIHDVTGTLDATAAMLSAIDEGCFVLTARPGLYRGIADNGPIVEI